MLKLRRLSSEAADPAPEPAAASAPSASSELDCLTCSACCRGHAGVIPVSAADLVRFRRAGRPELALRIVPGHFGDEAMETRADGACVHLGRPGLPHHCSIYEVRPDICGEFERGSWQCHEARRFDARTRGAAGATPHG